MATLTITNAALNAVRDNLNGVPGASVLAITWIAWGTGTQGSPITATQLATEVFRKQITSTSLGANPGEGIINGYLAPTDIAGTAITEVGFFADGATSTPNSGLLVFYGLYSHTHVSTESIQFAADNTV
jgi:hypothetical protein